MKKFITISILILVILVIFLILFSQSKKTGDKKDHDKPLTTHEQKKSATIKFSMDMLKGDFFDIGYDGMAIEPIMYSVKRLKSVHKGEFESTVDFNTRKKIALKQKFLGDLTIDDTFAFVVKVREKYFTGNKKYPNKGLNYDYNADTGLVKLFVDPEYSEINSLDDMLKISSTENKQKYDQFTIEYLESNKSEYQATNAFGTIVTVEKTSSTKLAIAANKIPFLAFDRKKDLIVPNVKLKMDNQKAASELPVLRALIVMKLTDPYILEDMFHSKPTLSKPSEDFFHGLYLCGDVLGIIFYSGLTGEIFARMPVSFGNPSSSKI